MLTSWKSTVAITHLERLYSEKQYGIIDKLEKQSNHKIWISNKSYDTNTFPGDHRICKLIQPSQFATAKGNCLRICFRSCQLRWQVFAVDIDVLSIHIILLLIRYDLLHRLKWKNEKNIFLNVCRLYNIKSFTKKCYLSHVFSCYYYVL